MADLNSPHIEIEVPKSLVQVQIIEPVNTTVEATQPHVQPEPLVPYQTQPEVSEQECAEIPDPGGIPEEVPERRYPARDRHPPERYIQVCAVNMTSDLEPETFKEVLDHPQKDEWLKAMQAEYDSLQKHGTWTLVDRPKDRKMTKCKWVFKLKKDTSGQVLKYKARLVAKGFTQVAGVDYGETFSPVARLSSVRLLMAYAAEVNCQIDHLDVETAFLNGDLEEEIFMKQPEGFLTDPKQKVYSKSRSMV